MKRMVLTIEINDEAGTVASEILHADAFTPPQFGAVMGELSRVGAALVKDFAARIPRDELPFFLEGFKHAKNRVADGFIGFKKTEEGGG